MTSPVTETITHTHIDSITKTYNSEEFLKEVKETISDGNDIVEALHAPVGDTLQNVGAELTKKDPNYLKVVIYVVLALLSVFGSFFGVWFGTH